MWYKKNSVQESGFIFRLQVSRWGMETKTDRELPILAKIGENWHEAYRLNRSRVVKKISSAAIHIGKWSNDFMRVSCPEPESDKTAVTLGHLAQKGHVGYQQISREVLHEILASQLRFGFPVLSGCRRWPSLENHGMSLKTPWSPKVKFHNIFDLWYPKRT